MKEPLLLSRRKALALSAAATVAVTQGGAALATSSSKNAEMLTFQELVGQTFAMRHGSVTSKLQLVDVTPVNSSKHTGRAPFSVILRGDDQHFECGTCQLMHASLGSISVFLHRVGLQKTNGQFDFEAVFA